MSKEVKAKEYSKKMCSKSCRSECEVYDICTIYKERIKNYLAGYTQAEQDHSSQLTACKEALREAVRLLRSCSEYNAEIKLYQWFVDDTEKLLTKAKTLIE